MVAERKGALGSLVLSSGSQEPQACDLWVCLLGTRLR